MADKGLVTINGSSVIRRAEMTRVSGTANGMRSSIPSQSGGTTSTGTQSVSRGPPEASSCVTHLYRIESESAARPAGVNGS